MTHRHIAGLLQQLLLGSLKAFLAQIIVLVYHIKIRRQRPLALALAHHGPTT